MTTVELITRHEGFRGEPYNDSLGHPTIGYGTLLPLTEAEAQLLLASRLDPILGELQAALPWFGTLDGIREAVLIDMAYQLGVQGLLKFGHTLAAIEAQDWPTASAAMLASEWAKQTPARAQEDAQMMLSGQWPGEGGLV